MMRIITLKACILTFSCLLLFLKSHSYQGNALEDYIGGNQDVGVITSLKTEGNMLDQSKGVGRRNLQTDTCIAKASKWVKFCQKQCPSSKKCSKRCICDSKAQIISSGTVTCKEKKNSATKSVKQFCSTKCEKTPKFGTSKCLNRCKCVWIRD